MPGTRRSRSVMNCLERTVPNRNCPRYGELSLPIRLPSHGTSEFLVKLASPALPEADRPKLLALDFATARLTLRFWSDQLGRGARFQVPENRWSTSCSGRTSGMPCACRDGTAARLRGVKIDLPYSNFAYGQEGTPWPINQAVYVDDMIYNLRGYHDVALEELLYIYQQQPGAGRARRRLRQLGRLYARDDLRVGSLLLALPGPRRVRKAAPGRPSSRWTGAWRPFGRPQPRQGTPGGLVRPRSTT